MNTRTYTAELAAPQTKYADSGKPMTVCIIVNGIDVRHDCEGGRLPSPGWCNDNVQISIVQR